MALKKKKMKVLTVLLLLISILCACILSACKHTLECGTWAFSGDVQGTGTGSAFPISSAFTFNPANCGSKCDISTDCIIQMVAVYNSVDRDYQYPNSGQEQRASPNGWSIVQLDGWAYGYYGAKSTMVQRSTMFTTLPGATVIRQHYTTSPAAGEITPIFIRWMQRFLSILKSYNNRILGYYFWSWTIDNDGSLLKIYYRQCMERPRHRVPKVP